MVDYDLIIVGSGPAGMNACLYATRANLSTLVIEKNYPGGKIVKTDKIENYLGTEMISGPDLALSMFKHSYAYGGVYEQGNVIDIVDYGDYKEVVLEDKKYKCYAVILAIGTSERKIGIPGEERLYGKGVSYCAVCDGLLYKNKEMVVIGSSKHALEESEYLSQFANKLYIITKQESLDDKQILNNKKIEVLYNSEVTSINGKESVESITVKNSGEYKNLTTRNEQNHKKNYLIYIHEYFQKCALHYLQYKDFPHELHKELHIFQIPVEYMICNAEFQEH